MTRVAAKNRLRRPRRTRRASAPTCALPPQNLVSSPSYEEDKNYAMGVVRPEWSKPVSEGGMVPAVVFKTRRRSNSGVSAWRDVKSEDLFRHKRVVLFAVPGAFTPRCSDGHVSGYLEKYDEIRALGIDDVYCVSVNDSYTMRCWGLSQGMEEDSGKESLGFKKIKLLPDGAAHFTRGMGMSCMWDSNRGYGERSWRYSAVVNNMKIEKLFVEGGRITQNASSDLLLCSAAEVMVSYLKSCTASLPVEEKDSNTFETEKEIINATPCVAEEDKFHPCNETISPAEAVKKIDSDDELSETVKRKNFGNPRVMEWARNAVSPKNPGKVLQNALPEAQKTAGHIFTRAVPFLTLGLVQIDDQGDKRTEQTEHKSNVSFDHNDDQRPLLDANKPSEKSYGQLLTASTVKVLERGFTTLGKVSSRMSERPASQLSKSANEDELERIISDEYPEWCLPNAGSLIHSCTHFLTARIEGAKFSTGDWVEVRGVDMVWRLEMVTRVVKHAPDGWDWNDPDNEGKIPNWIFHYDAGCGRMLEDVEVRAPKEGLLRIFGRRPWVWQQWACLKLEDDLRFQKGHQLDYFSTDISKTASALWEQWLNSPSNADFKKHFYDDRIGGIGRKQLINHIMKPFELMDDFKREGSSWNFYDDDSISIFTYLSILGSGFFIPLVICLIQDAIPLLLFLSVLEERAKEEIQVIQLPTVGKLDVQVTKCMVFIVMLLYLCVVVPKTCISFCNTVGSTNTVYSRLMSLRNVIWKQRDDTMCQRLGFKIELYMNTAYVCILYMLNMYILFKTDNALEVLLNALAVEFVTRLDEEVASGSWWDPDKRWITAGAAELVLQRILRLEWMESRKLFSYHYGVSEEELLNACDGDPMLFKNDAVASVDSVDLSFMTKEEAVIHQCMCAARRIDNKAAMRDLQKPTVHFGWLDDKIFSVLRIRGKGMFQKFVPYRTWSRWEKILYCSPLPNLEDIFILDERGQVTIEEKLFEIVPTEDEFFANFDPSEFTVPNNQIFLRHFFDILTLRDLAKRIVGAIKERKKFSRIFFHCVDGCSEWIIYVIQVIFPLVSIIAPVSVLYSMFGWESYFVPKNPFAFIEESLNLAYCLKKGIC